MTTNKTIDEILHEHYRDEGSHTPESQICETCVAELNQLILQERINELEKIFKEFNKPGLNKFNISIRIAELKAQLEKSKP